MSEGGSKHWISSSDNSLFQRYPLLLAYSEYNHKLISQEVLPNLLVTASPLLSIYLHTHDSNPNTHLSNPKS